MHQPLRQRRVYGHPDAFLSRFARCRLRDYPDFKASTCWLVVAVENERGALHSVRIRPDYVALQLLAVPARFDYASVQR